MWFREQAPVLQALRPRLSLCGSDFLRIFMMKDVSTFVLIIALCVFDTVVTARPLSSLAAPEKGSVPYEGLINTADFSNYDDEPVKRGDGGYESETMINTPPFMPEDDNEPIKRNNGDVEADSMINARQLQNDNDKRKRFYNPLLNDIKPSSPPTSSSDQTVNDDPWPIDKLPVTKRSEHDPEKRRVPGINPTNYFGNDFAEQQSDGSDDLFGAGEGGEFVFLFVF